MQAEAVLQSRILIVDDQQANVTLLERILQRAGYVHLTSTTDPRDVAGLFTQVNPDLILLDLHMPYINGYTLMKQLQAGLPPTTYLPMLVLTADITPEVKREVLAAGAKDFLTKPLDTIEVLLRIKNLLEARYLHRQMQEQNTLLEQRVRERTKELEDAQAEIIDRLARASEFRDDNTGQHTQRVGRTSALIARSLGLAENEVELILRAAPLHDVGKIGIPDHVLLKPGRLTAEEFEMVKNHTIIGDSILRGSRFPLLQLAEQIALTHQERWDGSGYPRGLKGGAIPLAGRIVAVADVFDALTSERPYKKAWTREEAVAELTSQRDKLFDPEVIDAFLALLESEQL